VMGVVLVVYALALISARRLQSRAAQHTPLPLSAPAEDDRPDGDRRSGDGTACCAQGEETIGLVSHGNDVHVEDEPAMRERQAIKDENRPRIVRQGRRARS
jgi:hypothetical protein